MPKQWHGHTSYTYVKWHVLKLFAINDKTRCPKPFYRAVFDVRVFIEC